QALIMGMSAIGSATSPLLFAFLIGAMGWRTPFWLAAALTALVFVLWYAVVRDRPPGVARVTAGEAKSSWKQLARNRNLAWLTWAYFCLNYFEYIFFYWIYYYFGQVRHFTPAQSSQFTAII